MRKKKGASSVQQRKLMGYAYACATGKAESCPPSIKAIGKSFMKSGKRKGLKKLRDFASTKHQGLPLYKENLISKFYEYSMNENKDVYEYLYSFKDPEINGCISHFLSCMSIEKKDALNDLLLEIGDKLDDEKFKWVDSELKKEIKNK
jgi:hypothetical protein